MIMADIFYSPVSALITLDQIPERLSFIGDSLNTLLSKIYYRNIEVNHTATNSFVIYDLDIVSFSEILRLEIPGTGLELILNPDLQPHGDNPDVEYSVFPLSLSWKWDILNYISNFKISSFSGGAESFFMLLLNVSQLSQREFLLYALNNFIVEEEIVEEGDWEVTDPVGPPPSPDFEATYDYIPNELADYVSSFNNDQLEAFVSSAKLDYPTLVIQQPLNDDPEIAYNDIIEAFDVAGLSIYTAVLEMYLIDEEGVAYTFDNLNTLFSNFLGNDVINFAKELLIPQITATAQLSAGLDIPRSVLLPLNNNNEVIPGDVKTRLIFQPGEFVFDSKSGFGFDETLTINFHPDTPKAQIGNTGLIIAFINAKLDVHTDSNIPEADAAGYAPDFVGLYVQQASIEFTKFGQEDTSHTSIAIIGKDLLIGTGGFSGTIGLEAEGSLYRKFGSFAVELNEFSMAFRQNSITGSNIRGSLKVKGFKDALGNTAEIAILVHFGEDGDFNITAVEADGIPLIVEGVFTFFVKSLSLGRQDGRYFIGTTGDLLFDEQSAVGKIFDSPLEIGMVIWDDGSIQLKGLDGAFKLKEPKTLELGPAKITVTAVHHGTHEQEYLGVLRKYWFFGFDGGISINPGGIDARGDGIKLYFTVDDNGPLHVFFRIQSLTVDIIILAKKTPAEVAVIIKGYLSMKEPSAGNTDPGKGTEYIGGVDVNLPKLSISGTAAMRLNPAVPSFIIDLGLSLPKAIPLGSTGLGIYGFRGLLGQKYVTSKTAAGLAEDASWYQYYKAKVAPDYKEGIQVSKFANSDGFTAGAGVSLATNFDGGRTFSSKLFFMLSLPEVFLLEGQAAILRKRIDLDTTNDPPFYAMISLSPKSVEAAFGVNLRIPEENGKIASVTGLIEMGFFYGSAGSWYLNIGRDNPKEKRVTARILTLFDAYFYFMIGKQGIRAGAGAKWEFKKGIKKVVSIEAGIYLELAGKVSFKPVQIGGSIRFGGYAQVRVLRLTIGISLDASLAAEAPKPFIVSGSVAFKLKLPWPIRKLGGPYKIDFTWNFNKDLDLSEIQLLDPWKVSAVNIMSGETFPIYVGSGETVPANINDYIIPVDSYIDIEFLKGMGLANTSGLEKFGPVGQGADFIEYVAPQKAKSEQVRHTFKLKNIQIYSQNGQGEWVDYNVYDALTPLSDATGKALGIVEDQTGLKYGYWQSEDPNKYNKLRIFSRSSLSYTEQVPDVTPEEMGFEDGFLFCSGQLKPSKDILFTEINTVFEQDKKTWYKDVLFRLGGASGLIYHFDHTLGLTSALATKGMIELFFPEPYALVKMTLGTYAEAVLVTYYQLALTGYDEYSQLPQYEYTEIAQETYLPSELTAEISYDYEGNNDTTVDKITIEPLGACVADGMLLNEVSDRLLQENRGLLVLEEGNPFSCQIMLFELCLQNVLDYSFNSVIPGQAAVQASVNAMKEGFEACLQPIWRPDTTYRLMVQTQDVLNKGGREYTNTYNFIFKTVGPLGHFHRYKVNNEIVLRSDYQALLLKDLEDQYKLSVLKHYIDMDRSYPNADGRLINAKPLFYNNPKLSLFYKYDYVYTMFNDFAGYEGTGNVFSKMQILIKDPTEPVSAGEPTPVLEGLNDWKKDEEPNIPGEMKIINNLSNGFNCSGFQQMIKPLAVVQQVSIATDDLKPDRLYTALFNAVYKGAYDSDEDSILIHNYVFKTSIYSDFTAQVQSCVLKNEAGLAIRKAIYKIEKEMSGTAISDATTFLNPTTPVDETQAGEYADRFDRLMDGILKLGVLPPAVTTDFNFIIDSLTGRHIGVLVRSPEPFNDPKILESELADTLQLAFNGTNIENQRVVFSKDRSKVFLSNPSLNLLSGSFKFTFKYKQFDGRNYTVMSTETVEFDYLTN